MTDISKYKNVSLTKDTYTKIDQIRRVIVPNTIISRSQTVNILVNEKVAKLNGKGPEASSPQRKKRTSKRKRRKR
jgi:hypothetical protein|tara:strand:- start:1232 stop:1456 length:225 start_codon:yes stop_codon:yes gene_type:complete